MRIARLAPPPAALLLLAACSNDVPPPVVDLAPPPASTAWGIDLARDTTGYADQLQHGQIQFVARYYRDPSSRLPPLTPAEARRLSALGLKIVAVFESHSANPAYFSYARGYWDAVTAARQARGVGQPDGSAIYFGVDFNARADQVPAVENYFRGIATGMAAAGGGRAAYKIGVYGSGAVCGLIRTHGLAEYAWLSNSTAWAGAATYRDWNIKQSARYATLSFDHDADEAVGDYGGFQVGAPSSPLFEAVALPTAAAAAVVQTAAAVVAPPAAARPPAPPSPDAAPVPTDMAAPDSGTGHSWVTAAIGGLIHRWGL